MLSVERLERRAACLLSVYSAIRQFSTHIKRQRATRSTHPASLYGHYFYCLLIAFLVAGFF